MGRGMMNALLAYVAWVLVLSLITFAIYGSDKQRAGTNARRVPEQTLHLLALGGGWPGAWLGQRHFRHKTKKRSFLIVFWCLAILHVATVGAAASLLFNK
jgi:uncharacterized membrane protein YsdA (DUF1294 family)